MLFSEIVFGIIAPQTSDFAAKVREIIIKSKAYNHKLKLPSKTSGFQGDKDVLRLYDFEDYIIFPYNPN